MATFLFGMENFSILLLLLVVVPVVATMTLSNWLRNRKPQGRKFR
jgi:hypothetical protein